MKTFLNGSLSRYYFFKIFFTIVYFYIYIFNFYI